MLSLHTVPYVLTTDRAWQTECLPGSWREKRSQTTHHWHMTSSLAPESVQGATPADLKSVRSKAAEAIVDFMRFPDQYQFDLLEADAVKQLQEDP